MTRPRKPPASTGTAPPTLRCAIYARKSTTAGLEQEFNSLDSQRAVCLAHIKAQPTWQPIEERYEDGGFTGANLDRPAFARLMQDIHAHKIDVLVVYKVDRLSRSLSDFTRCIDTLTKAGVSFVSVTERFSTADAMGRLTMNMLASFAEFEREMVAERTRDKVRASRRRGLWTGGSVPMGYVAREKKLLVDEPRAHIVRRAFSLFQEHLNAAAVARKLEAEGLLPPAVRGARKTSGRWSRARLGALLRNPLYAGLLRCGAELVAGEHPPLIERSVYDEVQAALAGKASPRGLGGPDAAYALRGLMRCGACGMSMLPSSTKSRGTVHRYYRCSTRIKVGGLACTARLVPAAEVERVVVEQLQGAFSTPDMKAHVAGALRDQLAVRRAAAVTLREEVVRSTAEVRTRTRSEATEASGDERSIDELRSRLDHGAKQLGDLQARLADADRQLRDIDAASKDVDWMLGALDNFPKVWEYLTPHNRWQLLGAIVDHITVRESSFDITLVDPVSAARGAP